MDETLLQRIFRIPIVKTLGMDFKELNEGICTVEVPHDKRFDGVYESMHGGLMMTVADSIACFAIMSRTGPEQAMTTTDMNIRFLAACLTDVTATARVIKLGRTLCPVAVDLFDSSGRHCAVAQVTYMLLDRIPKRH